jgi:hypothetical protein
MSPKRMSSQGGKQLVQQPREELKWCQVVIGLLHHHRFSINSSFLDTASWRVRKRWERPY